MSTRKVEREAYDKRRLLRGLGDSPILGTAYLSVSTLTGFGAIIYTYTSNFVVAAILAVPTVLLLRETAMIRKETGDLKYRK